MVLWRERAEELRLPVSKTAANGGRLPGPQAGCGNGNWSSHFKGDWTGIGPQTGVALTNWAPSFTPTLPHLLLPICSSTAFWAKAKDEGWGEIVSFNSLIR